MEQKFYKTSEVAEMLSVSPGCVRRWCRIGTIPSVKLGSCEKQSIYVIPVSYIENLMKEGEHGQDSCASTRPEGDEGE